MGCGVEESQITDWSDSEVACEGEQVLEGGRSSPAEALEDVGIPGSCRGGEVAHPVLVDREGRRGSRGRWLPAC